MDVLQFAFLMLKTSKELCEQLSKLELFSLLLACIAHDVGHTSYNNRFHCSCHSLLAILFNDQSVLENYHSLILFSILRRPRYNFCYKWDVDKWSEFRRVTISCILGTDMAAHFKYLKKFADSQIGPSRELDQDGRLMLAIMLVKCADISNIIRPFDIARRWGFKLVAEFFCQGDWERFLGQEPSFLTNRFCFNMAQGQEHFMLQVAGPLFRFVSENYKELSFCFEQLEKNVQLWKVWVPEEDELVMASEDLRPFIAKFDSQTL